MIIIIVLIAIILLLFLIWFIKCRVVNVHKIKALFNANNLVVCGKKGSGKDTLMSFCSYGKEHNSNVPLHPNTNIITMEQLMIPNLTRHNLVNRFHLDLNYEKYKMFENMTIISDSQLYFPSYDDSPLKKEYPFLANTYSIWRHLFDSPLHFNTQNIERLWKILREQLDECIMCLDVHYGLIYVKSHIRYYERTEDAIKGLKPLKMGLFNKSDEKEVEQSQRWEIKEYTLLMPKWKCQQDSYYFKKVVFKEDSYEHN